MDKTAIIIGGTFNPITKAHLQMGILAKAKFPDADIYYTPSNLDFISKWKDINTKQKIFLDNRIKFIKETIKPYNFQINLSEVKGITNGTTFEMIQPFKSKYSKIYICIGFDKINEIPKWSQAENLLKEMNIILFTRSGKGKFNITNEVILKYIDQITEIDMSDEYQEMSSTKIREAYKCGKLKEVRDMLPDEVYEILKNK